MKTSDYEHLLSPETLAALRSQSDSDSAATIGDDVPEEPQDAYEPRGELLRVATPDNWDHKAAPRRKMALEWFDDAATIALDDPSTPLIEDTLDEGALSVIYGDSNSGKTFVALDMAHAVASEREWNGKKTKRGLVVYVAAEGGRRITRRIAALRRRYPDEKPAFALIRYPIDLRSSDANLRDLITLIRDAESQCGERCAWVVVDTLSRALAGGDENSPVDMGRIVLAADRIRAETQAHFTYVHHTGKDAARGARGHSLLRAATDTEIEISPNRVKVTKQRDMEGGEELGFSLVDEMLGEDASGRMIKSAVVEWRDGARSENTSKTGRAVPSSQRLLMETISIAIDESGETFRPFATGPLVRAVSDEIIRERYYARIAEKPRPDDTPLKIAERQRKAFNRAVEANLKSKRIAAIDKNGERVLWLL